MISLAPALLLSLAQAASGAGSNTMVTLAIQFGAIIAIIYFIMIRPQQKQRQKHEAALRDLKRGDEIVTSGGIVGEVVHIREATQATSDKRSPMDDRVTIKSGESRLIVERGRIARIVGTSSAPATPPGT